ncbi:MAG TPA: hypothetical protein VIB49_08810 [Thermoplasmata archaeon]|jgi:hypothetical protein
MENALLDALVVCVGLVYYAILFMVFLLRAHGLTRLEWKLSPVFSALLVPFGSLWLLNMFLGNDSGRLIAGLPILVYLAYDLWYRAITRRKPYHHPARWPRGLVVYALLLFAGSVGLNWYGFLVSQLYGDMLVLGFFIMMGSFSYYQYRHNRTRQAKA